jgi:hypothetical protein
VRNPLRSEAEAYRFLLVTVGAAAAIVVASVVGGPWWGTGVAILVVGAVVWAYFRQPTDRETVQTTPRRHADDDDEHRLLVVANETVGGKPLREEIRRRAEEHSPATVLVVCPALNSPVRHWVSDEDGARARAQERLDVSVSRLAEEGIEARGEIGDGDPLQAIEDALRTFGADEIVISTHPEGRSHWLERGVVTGARARFAVPITHVVVDLEADPGSDT